MALERWKLARYVTALQLGGQRIAFKEDGPVAPLGWERYKVFLSTLFGTRKGLQLEDPFSRAGRVDRRSLDLKQRVTKMKPTLRIKL